MDLATVNYTFDIAVNTVIAFFGNNVMNHFFLASYLNGFPIEPVNLTRSASLFSRIIEDNPEKRFWQAVQNNYALNRRAHNHVCSVMLEGCNKLASHGILNHHARMMKAALISDIQFWENNSTDKGQHHVDEVNQLADEQKDENLTAIWELLRNYLAQNHQEYGENPVLICNKVNAREKDSSPITLLKALKAVIQDIQPSSRTEELFPFALRLMQKENGFGVYMHMIRDAESDLGFTTQSFYDTDIGRTLQYNSQFTGDSDRVINRYKRLLFYINFNQEFSKALKFFTETLHIQDNVALGFPIPQHSNPSITYAIPKMDKFQLEWITEHVKKWPNFARISKGQRPHPPQPKSSRPSGGSGS